MTEQSDKGKYLGYGDGSDNHYLHEKRFFKRYSGPGSSFRWFSFEEFLQMARDDSQFCLGDLLDTYGFMAPSHERNALANKIKDRFNDDMFEVNCRACNFSFTEKGRCFRQDCPRPEIYNK